MKKGTCPFILEIEDGIRPSQTNGEVPKAIFLRHKRERDSLRSRELDGYTLRGKSRSMGRASINGGSMCACIHNMGIPLMHKVEDSYWRASLFHRVRLYAMVKSEPMGNIA